MTESDEILKAQKSEKRRSEIIRKYDSFILVAASRAAGRHVDKSDDIYSEALIAFNDAVTDFDAQKGSFEGFAFVAIRNRIVNYLKRESRESVLSYDAFTSENDNGDEASFEIPDENNAFGDTATEIFSLRRDLEAFDISFFEMADSSPRTRKTVEACIDIAELIAGDKKLLKTVLERHTLPQKEISERLKVSKKVPERHRDYIIMGVLILSGSYEILSSHFRNGRRRVK